MGRQQIPRFIRRDDRKAIAGVAAAVAAGVGMPLLLARVLFVISIFVGFGIPLYVLVWFITPRLSVDGEVLTAAHRVWALLLIMLIPVLMVIGVEGMGLDPLHAFLLSAGAAVGGVMLRRGRSVVPVYIDQGDDRNVLDLPEVDATVHPQKTGAEWIDQSSASEPATHDTPEPVARLGGVCAWIARATGVNVTYVRIAVVIATVIPATFPLVPFLYGFAIFFVPRPERPQLHVR